MYTILQGAYSGVLHLEFLVFRIFVINLAFRTEHGVLAKGFMFAARKIVKHILIRAIQEKNGN